MPGEGLLDMCKSRAGHETSAHGVLATWEAQVWEWGDKKRKPREFQRQGGFKGEIQKQKCYNWKRKPNAQVSVPIRVYTDLAQGTADSAVCSSSWLFSGLA